MTAAGRLTWSTARWTVAGQALGAALLGAGAVATDPVGRLLLGAAALGCLAMLVRSLVARPALAADADGITLVTGLRTVRHIPWADVERISTSRTSHRLAVQSDLVVQADGKTLLVAAGRLGERPERVAGRLAGLRTGR